MNIEKKIGEIKAEAEKELEASREAKDIETIKVKYLGKKGPIQALMHSLKEYSSEQKPLVGKYINDLKTELSIKIEHKLSLLEREELTERLKEESIDVTLPGKRRFLGGEHVLVNFLQQAIDVFVGMGFSVQYGPDIESDYYNFEALNFPKDHPARDMHDTFYITSDILLRTQTSNTQVRVMEASTPPIRMIAPGNCYRNEDVSARSHVLFHQIEGLYIDKNVTLADLLSTLQEFFTKFFQKEIKLRNRPSYFPFVEPGVEVDIHCLICNGTGCSVCKHTGWLEVLGAGMVHPEVMKSGGIDPEEYNGYAWGMGLERLALLRYGINDIRLFLENDLRFLKQFV